MIQEVKNEGKRNSKKGLQYIAMIAIPHFCVIFFCLVMIFINMATPYISGFAVDSKGRIYVGEKKGICIYQDRMEIGSIEIKGDNYLVGMDESDNLLIVYTSCVDWIDSDGNIVKTVEDPHAHAYVQLNGERYKFVASNGDTYKLKGEFGWTRIVKNNSEIVYRQSGLSFLVKMLMQICFVTLFVSVFLVVRRVREMKETGC